MKIPAVLLESIPKSYKNDDGTERHRVAVSVGIEHDEKAHGFSVLSGSVDQTDFNPGASEKGYPRQCMATVVMGKVKRGNDWIDSFKIQSVRCN